MKHGLQDERQEKHVGSYRCGFFNLDLIVGMC